MVTVENIKNERITFSKNSVLKIVSVAGLHVIHFVDGSTDSFAMSQTDFMVHVANKLV